MENTKQPQLVTLLEEIDVNSQSQLQDINTHQIQSVNMRAWDKMEMPRFVNPEFVEMLQELADQFDAHVQYKEEALELVSELYEQMAERGDNPSALIQLKNRIGELKYLLHYNQIVVSQLFNAKHELIEIALDQYELAVYYQNEMGVAESRELNSEIGQGCCCAMLAKLKAWASEIGKWILSLLCLNRESVKED